MLRSLRVLSVAPLFLLPAVTLAAPGTDQRSSQQFHIAPADLPAPGATPSVAEVASQVPRGDHQPLVPQGFAVGLAMDGLDDPRRLALGPDGRLYLALQGAGEVVALREAGGALHKDATIVSGLRQAYGLGFGADDLLVGAVDGLYGVPLAGGAATRLTPTDAFGPARGHVTRSLAVAPGGGTVYVGVGSMNNISAREPAVKATIQKLGAPDYAPTAFATGMRNVTAMAFQPGTGDLYAVAMERDGMGDELVPDYLTRVAEGDDFGWPYQYIGNNPQPEFADKAKSLPAATVPDVLFAAHSAPLDLAFVPDSWPQHYRGGVIVALHGSWNAATPRGYKLVFVPFENGRPTGAYENFMTGFWVGGTAPAQVWGRPAALVFDRDGALLVADDLGGTIWRVTPPKP